MNDSSVNDFNLFDHLLDISIFCYKLCTHNHLPQIIYTIAPLRRSGEIVGLTKMSLSNRLEIVCLIL